MAAPSSPTPTGLPNPFQNPQLLADPYPLYAMLRSSNPVFRPPLPFEGPGVVILTRHADVVALLRDPRASVDRLRADLAKRFEDRLPLPLVDPSGGLRSMLTLDGEDHDRVRALVNKAFTPRRVAGLAPRIQEIVDDCLDAAVSARRIDLMESLAAPLPAIVIAELLGVPAEDHRQFKQWAADLVNALGQGGPLGPRPGFDAAYEALTAYLRDVIARRRGDPQGDLISAMIAAQEERDALSDPELLATSLLLLLAGHETTTNLIGNGVLALMSHRDQWDLLRSEPARVPDAIEELLRYDSPVQATVRVPLEDIEVGGHELPAECIAVCLIGAANRDPAVYAEPDRLDVTRPNVRHLSFGFGAHFCLGAGLARLEARIVFETLLRRTPDLAIAGEVTRRPNPILRGAQSLPVSF